MSVAAPVDTHSRKPSAALPWIICGVAALYYAYEYYLRISPSVMSLSLRHYFMINGAEFGNLSAFYYYAYAPMQIPVGIMMDRYGARRLLTFACLLCSVGTLLFVGPGVFAIAALGRFFVGFGSAFAFVGVLKLATVWMPPSRFAMIAGLTSALGAAGAIAGDITLTKLVSVIGWRPTLYSTALLGLVITVLLWVVIRDHPDGENAEESGAQGVGLRSLLRDLMVILRNKQIWLNGVIGCLLYLPTTTFAELWGIPYLKAAFHFSAEEAAYANSLVFLGFMVGGPIFGAISDRMGNRRRPMLVGSLLAAVIFAMVFYVPSLTQTQVLTLLFLGGVAYSAQVIVFAVGRELSPRKAAGTAIAVTNMMVMLGGFLFQPIIGKILDMTWSGTVIAGVHVFSVANYQVAMLVITVGLLFSSLGILFLRESFSATE